MRLAFPLVTGERGREMKTIVASTNNHGAGRAGKRRAGRAARGNADVPAGERSAHLGVGTARMTPSAAARAKKIRLLLMDVDGVLTDGHVYLQSFPDGTALEAKAFHSQDGAGLKLAHDAGLRTGVITGRKSAAVERRAKEVGMEFVYQGYAEKINAYEEIVRRADRVQCRAVGRCARR